MPPLSEISSVLRSRAAVTRIAAVAAAVALAGLVYAILVPAWFTSVVSVVPAKPPKVGISGLLGGELSGLAAGFDAGGGVADVARIAAVLESVGVADAVIQKLDLRTRYEQKHQEGTRAALKSHCKVKTFPKPNIVQLSCEDRDPAFAQRMVAYFIEHGNEVFRRVSASSATEEVRFLEKRVAELRQQADEASGRVRDFQEKYGIVDIETQTRAVVSSVAALNSERISKQLELDYARRFSSDGEATAQQLEAQISVVDRKLRDLVSARRADAGTAEGPPRARAGTGGLFPAALDVPKLKADFERLYRERKVAEATLIFSLERLEGARANQARDLSTFLVLDAPTLPTRKSRPFRALIVAVAAGLGAAAGFCRELLRARRAAALAVPLQVPGRAASGPVSPPRAKAP